jgi:Fur family ferric uptake transcriptional regulator/Fur family peroxide stress response transcriptional regulator
MITNKKERLTNQKRVILEYLKSTKSHPSAKEVYLEVKKKLPQISLGTVYRILNQLREKGEVKEILTEVSHFDGDLIPHSHFVCQKCKKIFDIFEEIPELENKRLKVGKINNYQIIFYGICNKCRAKNNLP